MFDSVQIEILESSKGPHGNQLQSKGATAYCIQLGRQTQNQSCRETQRSRHSLVSDWRPRTALLVHAPTSVQKAGGQMPPGRVCCWSSVEGDI